LLIAKCQLPNANCQVLLLKPLTLLSLAIKLTAIFLAFGLALKIYRSPRQLLAEVEGVLAANRPSFHHSPLEDVIELLCRGRHYAWVGIFLAVGENARQPSLSAGSNTPEQVNLSETRCKILVSIRLPSRELGVFSVESDREDAVGVEDRVLLEDVAEALARFLTGRGKYLVRRAARM
jgi:hypothetical protein